MALFKRFFREDISSISQVKSSVARGIRCEQRGPDRGVEAPVLAWFALTGLMAPAANPYLQSRTAYVCGLIVRALEAVQTAAQPTPPALPCSLHLRDLPMA